MVGPVIESLAEEYEGKTSVCKINVDENPDLAAEYKIMSIPTVMVIKDGQIVDKAVGVRTREEYQNMIEKAL
jgi:thioredoxin 1